MIFVKLYCCNTKPLQKVLFVDTVGMARRFFSVSKNEVFDILRCRFFLHTKQSQNYFEIGD
eukprot:UN21874